MKTTQTQNIAWINGVDIQVIENNGEKLVPVKPICEAIGIDHNGQRQRIERDKILSSTACTVHAVAKDKKEREMFCIPFKYVFGWLFTIDTNQVKEEAQEQVIKYQLQCYDALYNHFTGYADFVEQRQAHMDTQLDVVKSARKDFNEAKKIMADAEEKLDKIRKLTFEDYDAERKQLKLFDE